VQIQQREDEQQQQKQKQSPPPQQMLTLRYDYTNLDRISGLAKQFETMQSDCSPSKRTALFWFRNTAGLGSDLHLYSMALCNALQRNNVRLRSIGNWTWRDEEQCNTNDNKVTIDHTIVTATSNHHIIYGESPMQCYFPQSDLICPDPKQRNGIINITTKEGKVSRHSCDRLIQQSSNYKNMTPSIIRAATTEFLFTRVSNIVQNEAIRQLRLVFKNLTSSSTLTNTQNQNINNNSIRVPSNLITVHIRWGDKRYEVDLLPISKYINAVQQILDQRINTNILNSRNSNGTNVIDDDEEVNIFLATEDPDALQQFFEQKPKHWNVYIDQFYIENLPYRTQIGNVYNAHLKVAEQLHGRTGLVALGSLLVAMESNDYVLTTKSNWSRLINEIRKSIINPRCNDCTIMIDLNPGEV
jgi:hypothetical protein